MPKHRPGSDSGWQAAIDAALEAAPAAGWTVTREQPPQSRGGRRGRVTGAGAPDYLLSSPEWSIRLEAKHRGTFGRDGGRVTRWPVADVAPHQGTALHRHHRQGYHALSGVLLRMAVEDVYRIWWLPWDAIYQRWAVTIARRAVGEPSPRGMASYTLGALDIISGGASWTTSDVTWCPDFLPAVVELARREGGG